MAHVIKLTFFLALLAKALIGCEQYESFSYYSIMQCQCTDGGEEINVEGTGILGKWQYKGYYEQGSFNKLPFPPHSQQRSQGFQTTFKSNGKYEIRMAPNTGGGHFEIYEGNRISFTGPGTSFAMSSVPEWEGKMVMGISNARCYLLTNDDVTLYIAYKPDGGQCKTMKFERNGDLE